MKTIHRNLCVLVIGCLVSSGSIMAEQGRLGLAAEFGWGYANQEDVAEELGQELANSTGRTVTFEGQNGAGMYRLFAYYGLTDQVDLEMGYFSLSDIPLSFTFAGLPNPIETGVSSSGFTAGMTLNFSDRLYGRAGMLNSEVSVGVSTSVNGITLSSSESMSGNGYYLGGGYQINDSWSVAYTTYRSLGGSSGDSVGFFSVVLKP